MRTSRVGFSDGMTYCQQRELSRQRELRAVLGPCTHRFLAVGGALPLSAFSTCEKAVPCLSLTFSSRLRAFQFFTYYLNEIVFQVKMSSYNDY
jgi:hypothetical protein